MKIFQVIQEIFCSLCFRLCTGYTVSTHSFSSAGVKIRHGNVSHRSSRSSSPVTKASAPVCRARARNTRSSGSRQLGHSPPVTSTISAKGRKSPSSSPISARLSRNFGYASTRSSSATVSVQTSGVNAPVAHDLRSHASRPSLNNRAETTVLVSKTTLYVTCAAPT